MTLLTVAELLAGEALVTPGGPVDRDTAIAEEAIVWMPLCIDEISILEMILPAELGLVQRDRVLASV